MISLFAQSYQDSTKKSYHKEIRLNKEFLSQRNKTPMNKKYFASGWHIMAQQKAPWKGILHYVIFKLLLLTVVTS